jgi:NTE family protein
VAEDARRTRSRSQEHAPRVGLVLGAGGVVGQAYHAGVLAALEHDLGWDPRSAEVIVGTSAGSVTGTLLRLGMKAEDLAAAAVEAPLSIHGERLLEPIVQRELPELPTMSWGDLLRPWRMPSPALLARMARRPWALRPGLAASTLLPSGRIDLGIHTTKLEELAGEHLPERLLICAARRDTGARVVFGRPGDPNPTVAQAVAASCAIPGYFKPVVIDGRQYFDGGVHSPTNADILRRFGLDLVLVVSPMSAAGGRARTMDAAFRWSAHRRLQREANRLRAAGTRVVTFEPRGRSLQAMGLQAMATDRADRVVQAALLETGRRSGHDRSASALAMLSDRATRRLRLIRGA